MTTSDGVQRLRSFVAVPLPAGMQADLMATARGLGAALPEVKWSAKVQNLHITMRFLGNVPVDGLLALAAALEDAVAAHEAFPVSLRGFGAFPDARKATTVWAGVEDGEGRLERVAVAVEQVVERLGLAKEKRRGMQKGMQDRLFRPHVTVGRCKGGVDARRALEPWRAHSFGTLTVAALHLYESQLGGEGSTYVLRGRAPLAAGRAVSATL